MQQWTSSFINYTMYLHYVITQRLMCEIVWHYAVIMLVLYLAVKIEGCCSYDVHMYFCTLQVLFYWLHDVVSWVGVTLHMTCLTERLADKDCLNYGGWIHVASGTLSRLSVCFALILAVSHSTHTHTHNVLWLYGVCPGQPVWAGTRRNIHPLTHGHQLSLIHGNLPVQSTRPTVFFHNLSPSFLWSTSWPGTLHFILHTFLHPVIVFFSQHVPIPTQPVFL